MHLFHRWMDFGCVVVAHDHGLIADTKARRKGQQVRLDATPAASRPESSAEIWVSGLGFTSHQLWL